MSTRIDVTRFEGPIESSQPRLTKGTARPTNFTDADTGGTCVLSQVKTMVGDATSTTLNVYFSLPPFSIITEVWFNVIAVFGGDATSIKVYEVGSSDTELATVTAAGSTANVRTAITSFASLAGAFNAKNIKVAAVFGSAPAGTAKAYVVVRYIPQAAQYA